MTTLGSSIVWESFWDFLASSAKQEKLRNHQSAHHKAHRTFSPTIFLENLSNSNYFSFQTHKRWNSISSNLATLLTVINFLALGAHAKLNLCDVETGQTNIILDIEESRGDCKYSVGCAILSTDLQIAYWLSSASLKLKFIRSDWERDSSYNEIHSKAHNRDDKLHSNNESLDLANWSV